MQYAIKYINSYPVLVVLTPDSYKPEREPTRLEIDSILGVLNSKEEYKEAAILAKVREQLAAAGYGPEHSACHFPHDDGLCLTTKGMQNLINRKAELHKEVEALQCRVDNKATAIYEQREKVERLVKDIDNANSRTQEREKQLEETIKSIDQLKEINRAASKRITELQNALGEANQKYYVAEGDRIHATSARVRYSRDNAGLIAQLQAAENKYCVANEKFIMASQSLTDAMQKLRIAEDSEYAVRSELNDWKSGRYVQPVFVGTVNAEKVPALEKALFLTKEKLQACESTSNRLSQANEVLNERLLTHGKRLDEYKAELDKANASRDDYRGRYVSLWNQLSNEKTVFAEPWWRAFNHMPPTNIHKHIIETLPSIFDATDKRTYAPYHIPTSKGAMRINIEFTDVDGKRWHILADEK